MRIGVFDSGVGGLTVLRELQNRYPLQTFIYFGDTANVPYGTKSVSQIRSLSQHAAEKMKSHSLDLLIVACNTASSLALDVMKNELQPTPVIGVVEAGVNSVLSQMQDHDTALILGTRATVQSHIYRDLIQAAGPEIRVLEQACPLLVPMIEEGWRDHPILTATITEYVKPYLDRAPAVALLACTHYPWIKEAVQSILVGWTIIDSATSLAQQIQPQIKQLDETPLPVSLYFSDPDAVAAPALVNITDQKPTLWI